MSSSLYLGKKVVISDDSNKLDLQDIGVFSSAIASDNYQLPNKLYIDGLVQTQTSRIDTLLSGSSINLDTLKEISEYASTLNTQSLISTSANLQSVASGRVRSVQLPYNVAVWADGAIPQANNTGIYPEDGWYYIKNAKSSASDKFNWYIPPPSTATTVNDIQRLYAKFRIINPASIPFITVYTQTDSGVNAASWYKSRRVYDYNGATLTTGSKCAFTFDYPTASVPLSVYDYATVNLTLSTVTGLQKGDFLATEKIAFFAISSNSSASSVELLFSAFGVQQSNYTEEFQPTSIDPRLKADETLITSLLNVSSQTSNTLLDEINRAKDMENSINASIASLTTSLNSEISRAQQSESTLLLQYHEHNLKINDTTKYLNAIYQYFFKTNANVAPPVTVP